jgi:hypothetical protein
MEGFQIASFWFGFVLFLVLGFETMILCLLNTCSATVQGCLEAVFAEEH